MRAVLACALLLGGCVLDFDSDKLDPVSRFVQVDAAQQETCVLDRAGVVTCMGTSFVFDSSQRTFALDEPIRHIDASGGGGSTHNLAITESGALFGWGTNGDFELGLGDEDSRSEPTRIDDGPWLDARGGTAFSMGLRVDGTLWAFGWTADGQTALDNVTSLMTPTRADSREDWTALGAGDDHGCGLRGEGELWCWGSSSTGQTARGGENTPPMRSAGAYDALEVGPYHGCGLRGGELWCWGNNERGQLGRPSAELPFSADPQRVGTESDWTAVSAGWSHTCAIRDRRLFCWGHNGRGQLGLGPDRVADEVSTPSEVDGEGYRLVAAGGEHTCATRRVDGLVCMGSNAHGELGLEGFSEYAFPTPVSIPAP